MSQVFKGNVGSSFGWSVFKENRYFGLVWEYRILRNLWPWSPSCTIFEVVTAIDTCSVNTGLCFRQNYLSPCVQSLLFISKESGGFEIKGALHSMASLGIK